MSRPKQVIVIRKDLNMRKGKMCSQAAHASLKVFLDKCHITTEPGSGHIATATFPISKPSELEWLTSKFTKITVSVNNESELLYVYGQAKDLGLLCSLIQDAGDTEFNGVPTYTAVAIGPGLDSDIDMVTGGLPLL